ncbi:MAG TPA: M23 family metallopeptidase [Anaerolineales bacterium]|nr:M23 family metallopeptidase [Anaerolineae bacterium]HIQ01130.1 M23 family metallopeptidase [Anaerolineales bacterium]
MSDRRGAIIVLALMGVLLVACISPGAGDGRPPGDGIPPPQTTPPPQALLTPGELVEGDLGEGEIDRWIFATVEGRLSTVEIWFRPATASGPEAEVEATLIGPDGEVLVREIGTVTLPPYIVERELPQTGSYLLRLTARSGAPGRYTLLVTLSDERLLTRPEVYTGTLSLDGLPAGGEGGSPGGWGFIWPSPRRGISGWYFHDPENPSHNGLDIAAALHDPIVAAAAGTVSFAGPSGGYGNLVLVDHADGWQTWYAHLSYISVTAGQEVAQGEVIGAAGSTGYSTGPHLHFELRHQGRPVDPLVYLR